MSSIKGITAEVVKAVVAAQQSVPRYLPIGDPLSGRFNYEEEIALQAITALLASGEVVLKSDVEELVGGLQEIVDMDGYCDIWTARKFAKKILDAWREK